MPYTVHPMLISNNIRSPVTTESGWGSLCAWVVCALTKDPRNLTANLLLISLQFTITFIPCQTAQFIAHDTTDYHRLLSSFRV